MKPKRKRMLVRDKDGQQVSADIDLQEELLWSILATNEAASRFWIKNGADINEQLRNESFSVFGAIVQNYPTISLDIYKFAIKLGADVEHVGYRYTAEDLRIKSHIEWIAFLKKTGHSDENIADDTKRHLEYLKILTKRN